MAEHVGQFDHLLIKGLVELGCAFLINCDTRLKNILQCKVYQNSQMAL
jgi:hypothetical protein